MSVNHSLVEYRQAATGKGEGEPAMSRNQTSLSTVAAVRMDNIMMSDEYEATEHSVNVLVDIWTFNTY